MLERATTKSWFASAWGWPARVLLAALCVAAIGVFVAAGGAWKWVAGILGVSAFVALHVLVHRQGGWGLLGPHFYYDVVRLARRGYSTMFRVLYLIALLIGFAYVFDDAPVTRPWTQNDFARVSERFTFTLFAVQNLAILVLTPMYLASAIAEERERRTLELLFTTQLSDTQIVLGKLTSRIIHLFGFVIAGLPILCAIQFWGGIDMVLIGGNLVNTLLNILTIGSICLFISSMCKTPAVAVIVSYAVILPTLWCCIGPTHGDPLVLQDARQSTPGWATVQDLWSLALAHLFLSGMCLMMAILLLRRRDPAEMVSYPYPVEESTPKPATGTVAKRRKPRAEPPPSNVFSIPYTLPPVTDNALLWRERHGGGPPFWFSSMVQVSLLPFVVSGALICPLSIFGSVFASVDQERTRLIEEWSAIMRFFYYALLVIYVFGVAYRAATTVARERQQQTLEPLLLLPVERREILLAKLFGVLWRGWPWLVLIGADVALGTLIGAFHPFSAVLLCLTPWPIIFFVATVGLLLSVVMRTVLRASLTMIVVLMMVLGCPCVFPRAPGDRHYLDVFAFSLRAVPDSGLARVDQFTFALASLVIISMAAYLCWQVTLALFEHRGNSTDT